MRIKIQKMVERDGNGNVVADKDIKYLFEVQVKDSNVSLTSVWHCGSEEQIKERFEKLRQAFVEYTGTDDPEPVFEERKVEHGEALRQEPKRGKASGASRRSGAGAGRGSQTGFSLKGRRG